MGNDVSVWTHQEVLTSKHDVVIGQGKTVARHLGTTSLPAALEGSTVPTQCCDNGGGRVS